MNNAVPLVGIFAPGEMRMYLAKPVDGRLDDKVIVVPSSMDLFEIVRRVVNHYAPIADQLGCVGHIRELQDIKSIDPLVSGYTAYP